MRFAGRCIGCWGVGYHPIRLESGRCDPSFACDL